MTSALAPLTDRLARHAPWLHARLARVSPLLEHAREVLNFAAHRARDVRLAQVASSLTFTTVLSLVPLLAVLLAVFTAFPMFADLRANFEKNLLRELLPPQYASMILRYLNEFAAKAASLTALGLLFLLGTALAMIFTVDRVLNDIWQVRARRPLLQRLLVYWTLLTLGPVLVGASLSATSYLLSISPDVARKGPDLLRTALGYGPLLLSGFAFAALYVIVPARRVLWRDALIGGFAAALLGEGMRDLFTAYIRTGTIGSIYGAFAVVPLFLLWVYLVWFAILFGAAIAATLPRLRSTRFADERRAGNRFITAVALLRALAAARASGVDSGRVSLEDLARGVRTYPEETERLLAELERLDYVSPVEGSQGTRWLLTCDPQTRTLRDAFARLAIDPANTLASRDPSGLGAWVARGLSSEWVAQPLAQLFEPATPAAK
jgi:membrane protein